MAVLDAELEHRAAYAQAFGRAAIAFVFTMVDIRVGAERTFDLVPDVIGYWLFYQVASALLPLHRAAVMVRMHAKILLGLAALLLLVELFTVGAGAIVLPLGLLVLIGDVIMVWTLCGIVVDVGQHLTRPKLVTAAANRRRFYVAFTIFVATIPLLVVTFAGSDLTGAIATVLFVAFVAVILLVIQMYGLMRVTERVVTVD
ncbi:MAG TPA: hypothetical protein VGB52_00885 [Actinomycetota bacterium]